ncbi:MAG: hypothetical protein Ta2F_06960 [Termitinemataceae bacterium]|nr:MAG: hypothetical protein Ta2F_06960 [Termitinemataceae bacterium]
MVKKPKTKKQENKRTTSQVFDLLFKEVLHLSNTAVISFINGLFGTKYPKTAKIEYLNTERVNKKIRRRTSDIMLRIEGITYHIEAQINFDSEMVIRVFEYGFDNAVLKKTYKGDIRTIEFPQARIINLESNEKTPEKQILRLIFPDKSCYDYEVESFNLLKHDVSELEKRGLAVLLPFYVLKMRRQVNKVKTSKGRSELSEPLKDLVSGLIGAVERCKAKGNIDDVDVPSLISGLERLYKELFSQYDELAKGDIMLSEKLDTYWNKKLDYYGNKFRKEGEKKGREEGEKKGEKKATLKVAKNLLAMGLDEKKVSKATGLPLKTVQDLQKKPKGHL